MALNQPTGTQLLAAVRDFLEKSVAPQVDAGTQFHLRVANNVLSIVEREMARKAPADAAEVERLLALLPAAPVDAVGGEADRGEAERGEDGLLALNRLLVAAIKAGEFDAPARFGALLAHLRATTADKLAIDNPRYR